MRKVKNRKMIREACGGKKGNRKPPKMKAHRRGSRRHPR